MKADPISGTLWSWSVRSGIFILLLIISFQLCFSQASLVVQIQYVSAPADFRPPEESKRLRQPASLAAHQETLRALVSSLHYDAYLESRIIHLAHSDSVLTAQLHVGPQYQWAHLAYDHLPPTFLRGADVQLAKLMHGPMHYREIAGLLQQVLENAEDLGYPFASVGLDSVVLHENQVYARLEVHENQRFTIDSIQLIGDLRLSNNFLTNYLDLQHGSFYQRKKILQIPGKLSDLPYLDSRRTPQVVFRNEKANVRLFADQRNASRFDFILGILPQVEVGRNTIITGSFTADLSNQLAQGERIFIHLERFKPRTQKLNLALNYPFLLNIPFGIDLEFDLHKEDTLFTDLKFDFGLQYYFDGINYFKVFWRNNSTSLIDVPVEEILVRNELPSTLDLRINGVGLQCNFQNLDYRFNPRQGVDLLLSASTGTKNIRKNEEILELGNGSEEIDPDSLYRALDLRSSRHQIDFDFSYFVPIGKRGTVKLSNRSGAILSDAELYANEIYRIGGNKLLRGFDEQSVRADFFSVFTLEYRFLFDRNAYFAFFADYGFIRNKLLEPVLRDQPFGFGAGINFETKAGIFGLSTAVGSANDSPIDLRSTKVHFGYVNLF